MKNTFTVAIIFLACAAQGQVFHTDPNNSAQQPYQTLAASTTTGASKIVIKNGYNEQFNMMVSDDDANWSPAAVSGKSSLSYSGAAKYVRIYSAANKFKTYKLVPGYSYSVMWDNANRVWVLQ